MKSPEGHPDYNIRFWKLNKAIYGLKQSGREWNKELNNFLMNLGFKQLVSELCLYVKRSNSNIINCILGVYVDDILIAGKSKEINITKKKIKNRFKIKEIGNVDFVIGIKFIKYKNGYILNQNRYLVDLLEKYNILDLPTLRNMKPVENEKLRKHEIDETVYRCAIGSVLYLAICTRPDIIFAVSKAARKSKNPTLEDWENVKRIHRYLKGTANFGLRFSTSESIEAYVDADYAGDEETRRSTTGFIICMGETPTSWCSKLQHCVSTSTAEA